MPTPNHGATLEQPSDWALELAADEPSEATVERARENDREAQEREDEQHDEYDDPDRGGEA